MNIVLKKNGIILLSVLLSLQFSKAASPVNYANPFWGWGTGNVSPAAMVPMGAVKLSPTMELNTEKNSGYYKGKPILGFTHTQTSGTGGAPRYGNLMVTPLFSINQTTKQAASYQNELASPGIYSTTLVNGNERIITDLTASHWVGIHHYTWQNVDSTANSVSVLLNLSFNHTRIKNGKPQTYTSDGEYRYNDNILSGSMDCLGGWGGACPYRLFFAIASTDALGILNESSSLEINKKYKIPTNAEGNSPELLRLNFPVSKAKTGIELRVAISYLSEADALNSLDTSKQLSFPQIVQKAQIAWSNYLDAVQIEGGDEADKVKFYSALRNTLIMPTNVSKHVKDFETDDEHFWDYYATWDLYRSSMPLYTLFYPNLQQKLIRSYLNIYKQKGWLPDAWIAGNYATVQGGSNADVVLADAIVKKLGGFDDRLALEAMLKNAEQPSDDPKVKGRFIQTKTNKGYRMSLSVKGSVSRAVEYAYNDYCIAQVANILKNKKIKKEYSKLSDQIFELYHPDYNMFWAKDANSNWQTDFSPVSKSTNISNDPYFYEGGSIIYSAWLPQNMQKYIQLSGGTDGYEKRLDSIFAKKYFKLTNEPEFILPYLYNYVGKHAKTLDALYQCDKLFGVDKNGLPGQDDSGAMSAWYVFRCLGFFPVAGQDLYLLGAPVFDKISFIKQNGALFTIERKNSGKSNKYVKQILLDGKALNRLWIRHSEILVANSITFEMTDVPSILF